MLKFIFAKDDIHFQQAADLFNEYAQWLGIDLGFQKFDEEIVSLQKVYATPRGCIILLAEDQSAFACIALRPINEKTAEVKRMYVQPAYRKQGYAARLLQLLEEYAISQKYECLKLDTLRSMLPAMELYKKQGYQETSPYYHNPNLNAVYFEKVLQRSF